MRPKPFSIESRDGRVQHAGDVWQPSSRRKDCPLVLIVPGGWFMERDGFMGGAADETAFVYLDLTRELLKRGFAVARYDNRGVRGNELSVDFRQDEDDFTRSKRYVADCIDNEVRRSVTPATLCDDLECVLRYATDSLGLDVSQSILLAHSEGGMHACRLISSRRIAPRGLVTFGTSLESPAAVMHWQCVDRYIAEVLAWDADGDGKVTAKDVEVNFADSVFPAVGFPREALWPGEKAWSQATLRDAFEKKYTATKHLALARQSESPYPDPDPSFELVVAANAWWQQWFTDETTMLKHLRDYAGGVCFHLGEIDSHLSASRSIALLEHTGSTCRARVILHPRRGHALRSGEPSIGPMDDKAKRMLAESVESIACAG